jgi:tetratricopeptide (TPR) repeat protein
VAGHDGYTGVSRERQGKAERNLEFLRRWIVSSPEDPAALYFLARELVPFRNGRAVPGTHIGEALLHLEKLAEMQLPPTLEVDAARLYGGALLAVGKPGKARQVLEEKGDEGVACQLLLADAELQASDGDMNAAGCALQRIRGCFDRQTRDRGPFSEPALAGPVARARAAEALVVIGSLEEARAAALEATTVTGDSSSPWTALAAVELAAGDIPAAIRSFIQAIKVDEIDPWAWCGMGEAVLALGDPAGATAPLRNAASLAPGWTEAEELLASAMLLAGDTGGIREFFSAEDRVGTPGSNAALAVVDILEGKPVGDSRLDSGTRASIGRILGRLASAGGKELADRLRSA